MNIGDNPSLSLFRVAARGLEAQRLAMGATTDNIANATTSRTADGNGYAVKRAVQFDDGTRSTSFGRLLARRQSELRTSSNRHLQEGQLRKRIREANPAPPTEIVEIEADRMEYDPTHPNADEAGYVYYPDLNVVEEMAHMISANRIYEANLTTVDAIKEMLKRTLEI